MKKLISLIMVLCIIVSLGVVAQASPSGNATAYCVGTNYASSSYSDIDTSACAQYAATKYSSMGLYYCYNTVPVKSALNGSYASGRKYLTSGIVFLDGHASSSVIQFNYHHSYGDYACGVAKGTSNYSSGSFYYWGLGNYALSDVALYVFAGCNTSAGSDNITSYAVSQGAKAAIGWYTSVGTTSLSQWLNRFNDKLSQGYTIGGAYAYADSFTYNDISVKSHYSYGDAAHNPLYYINASALNSPESEERAHVLIDARQDALQTIKAFLQKKEATADYFKYQSTENDYVYYDCALNYLDVQTNYAYTFCIQDDSILVYDNTHDASAEKICERIADFRGRITDESIMVQQKKERQNFLETVDGTVEELEQYLLYDSETDSFYSALKYIATDPEGLDFADTLLYPIEG